MPTGATVARLAYIRKTKNNIYRKFKSRVKAYLNGKLFVNISAFFRLFFYLFYKKMALTAQLA